MLSQGGWASTEQSILEATAGAGFVVESIPIPVSIPIPCLCPCGRGFALPVPLLPPGSECRAHTGSLAALMASALWVVPRDRACVAFGSPWLQPRPKPYFQHVVVGLGDFRAC